MSHKIWTMALDESGDFEAKRGQEEVLVIGGVLCPGEAGQLAPHWKQVLQQACKDVGCGVWPPHATQLAWEHRARILEALSRELARSGGRWLHLVEPPLDREATRLATFVRMFGEMVDLSARLAALQGARQLDVHSATRTRPLTEEQAQEASRRGIAQKLERPAESAGDMSQAWVGSYTQAEVRQALDALSREGRGRLASWPSLRSVEALPATYGGAHPGVFFADFACNFLRGVLAGPGATENLLHPLNPDGGNPPLIIARGGLRTLRGLDRALREEPPDLWRASCLLESLAGDARGGSQTLSSYQAARDGILHAARLLWDKACRDLGADLNSREAAAVGLVLSSRAQGALAAKTGEYEGTWRALETGWAGDGPLAALIRRSLGDREVSARLWRQSLECANHRGDVAIGRRAVESFRKELRVGLSFTLLADNQQVDNLEQVMLQNQLPADESEVEALLAELERAATQLVKSADNDGALIALAFQRHQEGWVLSPQDEAAEKALMAALGEEAHWEAPDRERGRLYGTAARSMAFCGKLDEALALATKARRFFADSPMDLRFNAAILARILLEKARLRGHAEPCPPGLREVLAHAGVEDLRKPRSVVTSIKKDASLRFTLDLVLRALLWTLGCVRDEGWMDVLSDRGPHSLLSTLASGELRSHPSELVARHAGELLSRQELHADAREWFSLSRELCEAAAVGSALRRFLPFTARLAEVPALPSEGRLGSLFNPSFEYR